ncbi:unnamed protein product [Polarella glacialis]|uniref:Nucleotide-diphospho-sugar transferase domain-containing protein n=1 Tax=Polarella glacialis TaxID=89957 RepID=A0A813DUU3_POLGL|nr:unnamed protein product [Polarella glacialis]CAE8721278.1 unnamed protein product [Polarella glacialis]
MLGIVQLARARARAHARESQKGDDFSDDAVLLQRSGDKFSIQQAEAGKRNIALVTLADKSFQKMFAMQLTRIRCYAKRHNYQVKLLDGNEYKQCSTLFFFYFRKHCTIAKWMESQPANLVVAVLDGDNVVAAPSRPLDKWADHDADVQMYNRCLTHEIAAGNYMARNTKFARDFMFNWAGYFQKMPTGWSSCDNGAIHLAVMEAAQVEGYQTCYNMYRALNESVHHLDTYWDFVHCAKQALGPARAWKLPTGSLTVWPRFEFFAVDYYAFDKSASNEVGPVFHHGIKEDKLVTEFY